MEETERMWFPSNPVPLVRRKTKGPFITKDSRDFKKRCAACLNPNPVPLVNYSLKTVSSNQVYPQNA